MLHHNGCPMPWQPTPHCVSLLMYHLTMFDQALRAAQSPLDNKNFWKTAKIDWGDELIFFHVNKHSPAIPCVISLFFFSTPDLKLKRNEFVYDGMLCFPLNPYHWHVVLFTVLPTPPRFGFCMHNFWISPMGCVACCIRPIFFYQCVCWLLFKIWKLFEVKDKFISYSDSSYDKILTILWTNSIFIMI